MLWKSGINQATHKDVVFVKCIYLCKGVTQHYRGMTAVCMFLDCKPAICIEANNLPPSQNTVFFLFCVKGNSYISIPKRVHEGGIRKDGAFLSERSI